LGAFGIKGGVQKIGLKKGLPNSVVTGNLGFQKFAGFNWPRLILWVLPNKAIPGPLSLRAFNFIKL